MTELCSSGVLFDVLFDVLFGALFDPLMVCPELISNRLFLESRLSCGVPNMTLVDEDDAKKRGRHKRVVGGVPAKPVSLIVEVWAEPGCNAARAADADPVADRSGGQQEDRLWRRLHRRMLGTHRRPLRQVPSPCQSAHEQSMLAANPDLGLGPDPNLQPSW